MRNYKQLILNLNQKLTLPFSKCMLLIDITQCANV